MFVVEGEPLVRQAVAAGWEIEAQFVAPDGEAVETSGEVFHLAPNVIERVASTESPRPLLATVRRRPVGLPAAVDLVVVADHLADPGNLGTIIRSAEAAGASAVMVTGDTVDPFSPKVVRASAGSLFRIPVVEGSRADLVRCGLRLVGTSSHRGAVYSDVDLRTGVALVLGNEAHGLDEDDPATQITEWVTIPHVGAAESLNVAMAATVLLFEVVRQRRGE